jgi:hypothetical protein
MNGIPIKRVQSHTHLGVTLSENVKLDTHISIILRKAWQRVGITRSLKFLLNHSSLERMYMSFILEYADVTWDNSSNMLKMILKQFKTRQQE